MEAGNVTGVRHCFCYLLKALAAGLGTGHTHSELCKHLQSQRANTKFNFALASVDRFLAWVYFVLHCYVLVLLCNKNDSYVISTPQKSAGCSTIIFCSINMNASCL